jgi:hypothetical protein
MQRTELRAICLCPIRRAFTKGIRQMNELQLVANQLQALVAQMVISNEQLVLVANSLVGPGVIELELGDFTLLDGTPLAKFADASSATPGFDRTANENLTIRWNNHGAPTAIACDIEIPDDLDTAYKMVFKALVSKVGATLADATTLALAAFFVGVGSLHDSDSDAGGTSTAITGDAATKTVQLVTRDIAVGDLVAPPGYGSINVKPSAGLLGTDDLCLHRAWIAYTKRAAQS